MEERNFELEIKRQLGLTDITDILTKPEIDTVIREIIEYKNPLRQNLKRVSGSGEGYLLNRRTAAPGGTFIASDGTFSVAKSTYGRISFPYKIVGTKGGVETFAQAAGRTYKDLLAEELAASGRSLRDLEENAIIQGGLGANEFVGLTGLIPNGQVVEATTGVTGAALTLDMLDQAFDKCKMDPDMIICSKRTRRRINALLQSNQRFVDRIEVKGGFRVMSYNNIPIFASTVIADDYWFDGSGTGWGSVLGHTGSSTNLFLINSDECFIAELQPNKTVPLAVTNSQVQEFETYVYETLVMGDTLTCAAIVGIT